MKVGHDLGMSRLEKHALRPLAYPSLKRLGPLGDGGYVVPDDQAANCRLLVSLGLSDEWNFDKDFIKLNPAAKIVGVDHTVGPLFFLRGIVRCIWKIPGYALIFRGDKVRKYTKRLHAYLDYFRFFKAPHRHIRRRVSGIVKDTVDISLEGILEMNPGDGPGDLFLKMDIEGSEYEVIPDIIKSQSRIRCLVIEFHELDRRTDEFNEAIRGLSQQFRLVHLHGNNCGRYDEGLDFPVTVEITLINKDFVSGELVPSAIRYPRPGLDFPNDDRRPDYELHFDGGRENAEGAVAPRLPTPGSGAA